MLLRWPFFKLFTEKHVVRSIINRKQPSLLAIRPKLLKSFASRLFSSGLFAIFDLLPSLTVSQPPLIVQFRIRRDRWIGALKTHIYGISLDLRSIYSQIPVRRRPVYNCVFCFYCSNSATFSPVFLNQFYLRSRLTFSRFHLAATTNSKPDYWQDDHGIRHTRFKWKNYQAKRIKWRPAEHPLQTIVFPDLY